MISPVDLRGSKGVRAKQARGERPAMKVLVGTASWSDKSLVNSRKFYPKDAAGSQWSFQNALDSKLKRWRPQLGKNVQVRRDIVLVMGNTREELEQMMLGTVFALQTANWRNEVDFWRSFVDVDFEFLDNLDKKWLE